MSQEIVVVGLDLAKNVFRCCQSNRKKSPNCAIRA